MPRGRGQKASQSSEEVVVVESSSETETELEVSVDDPTGTNAYTFLFPRVKINSADVGVDGPNSRVINMSFVALYDDTEATNLKITR